MTDYRWPALTFFLNPEAKTKKKKKNDDATVASERAIMTIARLKCGAAAQLS